MANYATLKGIIDQYITTNGQGDITGAILNDVLKNIVNSIGADYLFGGVVVPSSNVGTPDQNVFFIATQGGSYQHFDETIIPDGITIFKWNGSWTYQILFAGDGGVFDISAYHNNTKYADLTAALGANGANVPDYVRKGGMSIKFIQSLDDNYVQYRLNAGAFTINPDDWEQISTQSVIYSNTANLSGGSLIWETQQRIIIDVPKGHRMLLSIQFNNPTYTTSYGIFTLFKNDPNNKLIVIDARDTDSLVYLTRGINIVVELADDDYLCIDNRLTATVNISCSLENSQAIQQFIREIATINQNLIGDHLTSFIFQHGYITPDGEEGSSNAVIRSTNYKTYNGIILFASVNLSQFSSYNIESVNFNIHCYDINFRSLGRAVQGYQRLTSNANEKEYTLRTNTAFVRITMAFNNDITVTDELMNYVNNNFNSIFSVYSESLNHKVDENTQKIQAIENNYPVPTQVGYDGVKIEVKKRYLDFNTYMTLAATPTQPTDISRQGCTTYGKYFIQLCATMAYVQIYDLDTSSLVKTLTLGIDQNIHANSAAFSNKFYDESDVFPLLYVSTFNNNTVNVYRMAGDLTNLAITKIQTINLPGPSTIGYSADIAIDNENNNLVVITMKLSDYNIEQGNAIFIRYLPLPDYSESAVNISENDFLGSVESQYSWAKQGCYAESGKLYYAYGNTDVKAGIKVIDYLTGIVLTHVKMERNVFGSIEPEGICFYKGKGFIPGQDYCNGGAPVLQLVFG